MNITELLTLIGEINDSYEDLVWTGLNALTDDQAETMTVKEFLESIVAPNLKTTEGEMNQEWVGRKFTRHGRIFTIVDLNGPDGYPVHVRMTDGTGYFFRTVDVAYYLIRGEVKNEG